MDVGISITKKVLFRGTQQEFSNTYHYHKTGAVTGDWNGLVDEIVGIERPLHGTGVTFVRARVWSSGGSRAENTMLLQKDLTGTGSQAQNSSLDPERCILARWRVGVDVRGLPVYLRKWFHPCGNPMGVMAGATQLAQTAKIATGDLALIQGQVEQLRELGTVELWNLSNSNGSRIANTQAEIHPWWEHHQFGDMWR